MLIVLQGRERLHCDPQRPDRERTIQCWWRGERRLLHLVSLIPDPPLPHINGSSLYVHTCLLGFW